MLEVFSHLCIQIPWTVWNSFAEHGRELPKEDSSVGRLTNRGTHAVAPVNIEDLVSVVYGAYGARTPAKPPRQAPEFKCLKYATHMW